VFAKKRGGSTNSKFIAVIAAVVMLAVGSAAHAGGKQNSQGQNQQ
jgi:hypothetical protein